MERNDLSFNFVLNDNSDSEENFIQEEEEEQPQCLTEADKDATSEVATEELTEDDDLLKAIEFITHYSKLQCLNDKADNIYEQVLKWIECFNAIQADPTYLSLIQHLENSNIYSYTVISKKELDLGTLDLLLIYSSQNGTSVVTLPITFSQTSRRNIFYNPPPDCQKLTNAYLVFYFKFNKFEYSAAEKVYNKCRKCRNGRSNGKMNFLPAVKDSRSRNNGYSKMKFKNKTKDFPSNLKGDFEGEFLSLADIFNENVDDYDFDFDSRNDSKNLKSATDDSDDSSDDEEEDGFKQIFTFKLKIHVI